MNEEQAKKLRADFPPSHIGKMPRVTCKACSDKRTECTQHKREKCQVCKAFISTAHMHLDFVGHAAVTDRLLQVDPDWTWEPAAFADDGGPLIRKEGGEASLWIRLNVAGVSRYGVGIEPENSNELEKKLISDAIRNAAMRFGVALDLWAKEDLSNAEDRPVEEATSKRKRPSSTVASAGPAPVPSTPAQSGGREPPSTPAPMPPCEWSEADIRAMSPPQMMNALSKLGKRPEGTSEDWRAQLLELVQ